MSRAVAITGLGAVTAVGATAGELLAAVQAGACGIRQLTRFETRARAQIAAEAILPPLSAGALDGPSRRRLSRADRYALAAATEACDQAGLDATLRRSAAVAAGATTAGMAATEEAYRRRRAGAVTRFRASDLLATSLATPTAVVAQALGLFGPRLTVSTACSSSALAIGAAVDCIRQGRAAVALALGSDQLCRLTYAGFDALHAIDAQACRPFDRNRQGLSLGEGAGAMVLEDAAHARARGATVYGWVLGWATSTDAHHVTSPHPQGVGAVTALRSALADAERQPAAVDYVNAHGSGTPQNDDIEVGALRTVFGPRLTDVPISSSKSQLGHTLAAAGVLEAIVTVLAVRQEVVPPTIHLDAAEWPDLDFVATAGRSARLGVAVSSSYGFGGHNVTLVLAHPEAG